MRPSTGDDGDAIRRRLHGPNIRTPRRGDRHRSNKTVAVAAGTECMEYAGDGRRADSDSVSVRGESRGAGVASGHKDCVVCMDVFPQRQSLSGSNRL